MGNKLVWTFGMISIFGLAVACSSSKNAANLKQQREASLPSQNLKNDNQLLRPQVLDSNSNSTSVLSDKSADSSANKASLDGVTGSVELSGSARANNASVVPEKCSDNSALCDIVKMMEIQREAHIVFNQAWGAIWKENNTTIVGEIGSVFKTTLADFKQMYRSNGQKVTASNRCVGTTPYLENLSSKAGTRYVMIATDCQQSSRRAERVTFERLSSKTFRMTFNTSAFPSSSQGSSLRFLAKPVVCNVELDDSMKLATLSCEGLGQNRSGDEYAEMTTFKFSKNTHTTMLQIKGTKFRSMTEKEGDFEMLVPVDGPILYSERVIVADEPVVIAAQPAAAAPAVAAQPQTAVAGVQPVAAAQAANQTLDPAEVGRQQLRKKMSHKTEKIPVEDLLKLLQPDERRVYDLEPKEEQQETLARLKEYKDQQEAQEAQQKQSEQTTTQDPNSAEAQEGQSAAPAEASSAAAAVLSSAPTSIR